MKRTTNLSITSDEAAVLRALAANCGFEYGGIGNLSGFLKYLAIIYAGAPEATVTALAAAEAIGRTDDKWQVLAIMSDYLPVISLRAEGDAA